MCFTNTVKNCLKFLLCVMAYGVVFMLVNAFLPFSQGFIEASEQAAEYQSPAMFLAFVFIFWNCFTAYFIIRHANFCGKKLFVRLFYVMLFVVVFIPGLLAMESAHVHNVMWQDMALIMIPGMLSLLAMIPLMMKFFQNNNAKDTFVEHKKLGFKDTVIKLGLCGLVLLPVLVCSYIINVLGFEEYRAFYADTSWVQAIQGGNPIGFIPLITIPLFRGILNAFFLLPMLSMITKSKLRFITALCLLVLAPAMTMLVPNPLLPDIVRLLHFASWTGSMLLFGIIAGNILWRSKRQMRNSVPAI